MKEKSLTRLRWICFGIGIFLGFLNIYLQDIEYGNDLLYTIMVVVMGVGLLFYATAFIFIDTEKAQQKIGDVKE